MDIPGIAFAPYALLALGAVAWHLQKRKRKETSHAEVLAENAAAGLNEPPSLHPVVDLARCIGSGSCVRACPEQALGMVGGKAVLINASACIGHGACESACAFDAIRLVFGTETRGVEIPLLQPNFETNVPGIFIAGELGGMGLIRKAAQQGRQAMEAIVARGSAPQPPSLPASSPTSSDTLDALIVGAGPAGLSAALSATEHGLSYAVIEQESSLGGSIYHYPRQKIAMTAPVELSLVGRVAMSEISKESLLEFWQGVREKHDLKLRLGERMERVETVAGVEGGFRVHTSRGVIEARAVLLTVGRRGTPRTLDVPGEELPKVSYRLVDPAQYAGQAVLVVGGGDSALEAAIALANTPQTRVTLSYRSAGFSRVKGKNRDALGALQAQGRLQVLLQSQVLSISERAVLLSRKGDADLTLDNDAVIVCAGGVLPTPLLKEIGIRFETKHGLA